MNAESQQNSPILKQAGFMFPEPFVHFRFFLFTLVFFDTIKGYCFEKTPIFYISAPTQRVATVVTFQENR